MSKILIISIFINSFYGSWNDFTDSCEDFTVKAQTSLSGMQNGGVKIISENGRAPMKYIFYRASGELLSKDWEQNSMEGLKKGKYYCTVVDAKNCRKTVEFEIF